MLNFNLARLSVDIDTNYIGSVTREAMMMEERARLEAKLQLQAFLGRTWPGNQKLFGQSSSNRQKSLPAAPLASELIRETYEFGAKGTLKIRIENLPRGYSQEFAASWG